MKKSNDNRPGRWVGAGGRGKGTACSLEGGLHVFLYDPKKPFVTEILVLLCDLQKIFSPLWAIASPSVKRGLSGLNDRPHCSLPAQSSRSLTWTPCMQQRAAVVVLRRAPRPLTPVTGTCGPRRKHLCKLCPLAREREPTRVGGAQK